MKLIKLLSQYIDFSDDILNAFDVNLDSIINETICNFSQNYHDGIKILSEDFDKFYHQLHSENMNVQKVCIYLLIEISIKTYKVNEEEINRITTNIENNLRVDCKINKSEVESRFISMINIYHLFKKYITLEKCQSYFEDVDFSSYSWSEDKESYFLPKTERYDIICYLIPFAINALLLVGKLPSNEFYNIDSMKPVYPLDCFNTKKAIRKGVKDSEKYFLFKRIFKVYKGDVGDKTFLATEGSKIFYLSDDRDTYSVFSSKIAAFVSRKHFSSERLLNNDFAGSRELTGFISVVENNIRAKIKAYIIEKKHIFPGIGIIDETLNYLAESDKNIENFGIFSNTFDGSYLMKIDFDRCGISDISKTNYISNIFSANEVDDDLFDVQKDEKYIKEILSTRLKLSMLTESFLYVLSDKEFTFESDKENVAKSYFNQSNVALTLFLEHKERKNFITENPKIFDQLYIEIEGYIKKHFEEIHQTSLLESLKNRINFIHSKMLSSNSIEIIDKRLATTDDGKGGYESDINKGVQGSVSQSSSVLKNTESSKEKAQFDERSPEISNADCRKNDHLKIVSSQKKPVLENTESNKEKAQFDECSPININTLLVETSKEKTKIARDSSLENRMDINSDIITKGPTANMDLNSERDQARPQISELDQKRIDLPTTRHGERVMRTNFRSTTTKIFPEHCNLLEKYAKNLSEKSSSIAYAKSKSLLKIINACDSVNDVASISEIIKEERPLLKQHRHPHMFNCFFSFFKPATLEKRVTSLKLVDDLYNDLQA